MLLKKLTQTFGVSGYEKKVVELIKDEIVDRVDDIRIDNLGNLIAVKKGYGQNKKKIMISSHMDEIGFAVMSITEEGFLKVRNMGGISVTTSVMNKVQFKNGAIGVIGYQDGLDKIEGNKINKLYIDIGASSREEALEMVSIGETASYIGEYYQLSENRVMARALDDRVGVYIALETIINIEESYNDLYFVFSVQEEVGLRGAKVAASQIKPDLGIALDITGSYDVPENKDGNMKLGEGAAIKVMDNSVICDEGVVEAMKKTAEDNDIKYQMDILAGGGTDAGAINVSNEGVKAGGISIPTRNGHSPVSIVDMRDVRASIYLLTKFIKEELFI